MLRRLIRWIVTGTGALSLWFVTTVAHAAGPYENITPATFTNAANPCTGTPLTVSIPVNDAFTVTDLDLGLMITHDWRLDSQVTLISPANTSVVLIDSVDGNSSSQLTNYNVRLDDDDLANPVVNTGTHGNDPAAPNFASRVRPNSPLSQFDGENAFGTWTLEFCDVFASDDGTFTRAELIFAGQAASTPPELSCGATALRHDWNDHAWPSGSLTNTYSDAGEDFRVTVSGTTSALQVVPATTIGTPVTNAFLTGGKGATQESLFFITDHTNATNSITLTIDVGDLSGGPNNGVAELQFEVFDVDFNANQFQDQLTVTGTNGTSSVTPILSASTSNSVISPPGNIARGNSGADSDSAAGTITVTFLERVTQVTVSYGNGPTVPANPGQQAIALYDLLTCPVQTAVLDGSKSITTVGGGYALPGNDVIYKISINNTGNGATDDDSIILIDAMPSQIDFFRGAAVFEAVTFTETGGTTGLDFDYSRDVAYSNAATKPANFAACTYDPATGYDPTVTFVCINPKDTLAGGTGFDVEFRARIK